MDSIESDHELYESFDEYDFDSCCNSNDLDDPISCDSEDSTIFGINDFNVDDSDASDQLLQFQHPRDAQHSPMPIPFATNPVLDALKGDCTFSIADDDDAANDESEFDSERFSSFNLSRVNPSAHDRQVREMKGLIYTAKTLFKTCDQLELAPLMSRLTFHFR